MENVRLSLLESIHKLELPNRQKTIYKRYGKPPYSYAGMIIVAIMTSPNRMLSLSQIHEYLRNMFDFFQQPYMGWKDSVRHNLSHCKCFVKGGKTPDGRNNLWTVDMSEVTPSLFRRQQTAIAKDGNYAEDLHDELQIPRIDIPFFNYSRGAPSKSTSERSSSTATANGPTADSSEVKDVPTLIGSHGDQAFASSTAISSTDGHASTYNGPPTPVLYRLPSGKSANSPIVLNSPDKGNFTVVRPSSVLSSASSMVLRSLSEHSSQCDSPAFSDVTEPRTPDPTESDMSGFRPINEDLRSGWITPIGQVRDGSDLTRGASCLSDVSPSWSECSASRRVPKRKQIRHRPRVRKAMRTETPMTPAIQTERAFSEKTYADLQTLVTQSSSRWEISIDKAIGNLQDLCQPDAKHTAFPDTVQTSEDQFHSGSDIQTTFVTGDGSSYFQAGNIGDGEIGTPNQTYHILGSDRYDHTYSSPERDSSAIPHHQLQTSDTPTIETLGFGTGPTPAVDEDTGSLEEFANCALWYGLLS
ncbi:uncharacterized protein LOC117338557 [Pecten maximus]|uniref:uncharacterized protein LOC117338557 n=1 Tax=Pecten maximus TaxID=6579 RepID=UPI0014586D11|nr:uncharacterized protein LOC117338557 [Pecten maximus]